MNKEARVVLVLLLISLVTYASKYSLNVFMTHHLAKSIYGDFSIAIKLLTIMTALSLLGTDISSKRFLGKYINLNQKADAIEYVAWNLRLISVTFFISLLIALASTLLMILLHHFRVKHINDYHLAVYVLWLIPFSALLSLLSSYLIVVDRIYLSTLLTEFLKYLLQVLLFISVVLFVEPILTNFYIVSVLLITFILLLTLSLFSLNQDILELFKYGFHKVRKTPLTKMDWLKTSVRLITNNILFVIVSALDLLIVEVFGSNETMVGDYAAILTIIGFLWLIPTTALQALKSKLSFLLESEMGKKELQCKINSTMMIIIPTTILAGSTIVLFSKNILGHFGPDYVNASPALIILTFGVMMSCFGRIAPVILIFGGYEQLVLRWTIFELTFMIFVAIPATYYFNIIGTASATALLLTVKPAILISIVRKKFGLRVLFL
ncbi:hypothetical protein Lgra_1486 [Legionella gratiana]|uniref:Polysaccharide biosynthesis protein n=1 Tax=Legionella gratiana TaxID=45066 RepID=A0A378JHH2_9GAMM|nr:hypothetical protein [Legionella gratiana]KTD12028.1 hypothetical protein Lgra_1486 [Legionella gratiana]STX46368.1 Uncharacterised protein [Legionella gratiana]